jgi:TRAP-type C4-dicarboxylate transport system permease small subunit
MKWLFLIIGIIIVAIGAVVLSGVDIPHVTWRLSDAFNALPWSQTYTAIAFIIIGALIIVLLGLRSEMGKYFNFY